MIVVSANFMPDGLTQEARNVNSQPRGVVSRWQGRRWTGAGDRLDELESRVKRIWQTRPMLRQADLKKITAPHSALSHRMEIILQWLTDHFCASGYGPPFWN